MVTRSSKTDDPIDTEAFSADTAVAATTPIVSVRTQVKLRDLVERVMDRTGSKKNEVKSITEAVLQEMGTAIAGGEDLNLPGFGKVMVKKDKEN